MLDLVEKIVAVHEALKTADLPLAFGGALALAWCTERARGTIDIDINIFVPVTSHQLIIEAMPEGVSVRKQDLTVLKRDGQVRIWWDNTPLDLFLNTTDFHDDVAKRIRWEMFGGTAIPFLSCFDIAVFKVFLTARGIGRTSKQCNQQTTWTLHRFVRPSSDIWVTLMNVSPVLTRFSVVETLLELGDSGLQ